MPQELRKRWNVPHERRAEIDVMSQRGQLMSGVFTTDDGLHPWMLGKTGFPFLSCQEEELGLWGHE
jgi:hypothetical protein